MAESEPRCAERVNPVILADPLNRVHRAGRTAPPWVSRLGLRILMIGLLLLTCAASLDPGPRARLPTARTSAAIPRSVGALFPGTLAQGHSCSGSVVDSPGRDLVITAAHCVQGTVSGELFVPGYRRGATPDGVWTVTAAWVDAAWKASQDPHDDIAVLRVAATGRLATTGLRVQDVTGGEHLGTAPTLGVSLTVPGYVAGVDDAPIICTTPARRLAEFPAFDCHGYESGTSGSPFLMPEVGAHTSDVRWQVVGVIGGFHQGGCYDWRSLSAPFGAQVQQLLRQAEAGGAGSGAPSPGASGC